MKQSLTNIVRVRMICSNLPQNSKHIYIYSFISYWEFENTDKNTSSFFTFFACILFYLILKHIRRLTDYLQRSPCSFIPKQCFTTLAGVTVFERIFHFALKMLHEIVAIFVSVFWNIPTSFMQNWKMLFALYIWNIWL